MKKIAALWHKLLYSKTFIRIASVLIALVVWIIVMNVASPTNTRTIEGIPVQINYENSTPYRNGLMMLTQDNSFAVDVELEGPRTTLLTLGEDDVHAEFSLEAITAPGTYSIPVKITVDRDNVDVKSISPDEAFMIRFAYSATKTLPVTISYSGSAESGFVIDSEAVEPTNVTVTGPADTVELIDSAYVSVNLQDKQAPFSDTDIIRFRDAEGNDIDGRYLTLSADSADVQVNLLYTKAVPFHLDLYNSTGGNENEYTTLRWSQDTVTVAGGRDTVSQIEYIDLGRLDLSELSGATTLTYELPVLEGITYRDANETQTVDVTVDMGNTRTKTLSVSAYNLNRYVSYMNGSGVDMSITSSVRITVRTQSEDSDEVSISNLVYRVDTSVTDEEGRYKLNVSLPEGVAGTVLGEYYVSAE